MTCLAALCLAAHSLVALDGDTLAAGARHIRLWGIDAPELHRPGGAEARQALAALIAGQPLACDLKGRDHGRLVARCRLAGGPRDGQDLACLMVLAGQARDWPRYSAGAYAPPSVTDASDCRTAQNPRR